MSLFKNIFYYIKNNFLLFLAVIIILVINFVRVPYEVEMPGGTIDLTDRIRIDGKKVDVKGTFNMAYVSVAEGNIPYVLLSFIRPDWDLVKSEDNLYEGETISDAKKRNQLYLLESKNSAIVAALNEANEEYEITNKKNNVLYVDPSSSTNLKTGDNIFEVNGEKIKDVRELVDLVNNSKEGDRLNFKVERNNKEIDTYANIVKIDGKNKIGIVSLTTFDVDTDRKIEIDTKASESGPSGGLMMALMIYNSLVNKDLTNGKKIVGTGTISLDGKVGEIGGVKYKLIGAVKNKADVFLVPKENYKEALAVKKEKNYNIEVVEVGTLKEAIRYLGGDDNE